jgi:hypothetical protein
MQNTRRASLIAACAVVVHIASATTRSEGPHAHSHAQTHVVDVAQLATPTAPVKHRPNSATEIKAWSLDGESPPNSPALFRDETVNCVTLAQAVNHFVALGEDAAVAEFESLLAGHNSPKQWPKIRDRVAWICRIVFEPKADKPLRPPFFGELLLPTSSMPAEDWPLWPLAKKRFQNRGLTGISRLAQSMAAANS